MVAECKNTVSSWSRSSVAHFFSKRLYTIRTETELTTDPKISNYGPGVNRAEPGLKT